MGLFEQNLGKIEKDIELANILLEKKVIPEYALNLYETITILEKVMGEKKEKITTSSLMVAQKRKKKYLEKNIDNFRNNYVMFLDFYRELLNSVSSLEIQESSSQINLSDAVMNYLLLNYLNKYSPSEWSQFILGAKIKNTFYNVSNLEENQDICCSLLDRNYLFIANQYNVETMAECIYHLSSLTQKEAILRYGCGRQIQYTYCNNLSTIRPLIEKKRFLMNLKEKNDKTYHNEVVQVVQKDYQKLLSILQNLSVLYKNQQKTEDGMLDTIAQINYVYGQFLSDVYFALDTEQQIAFINFLNSRRNNLFKKDILIFVEKLLLSNNYDFGTVVKEQYKKYIKI